MRQFNEDFNGKCCDDNFKQCDWTCEEIIQRISSRAAIGVVYTRAEIDSKLQTLRSLISTAAASNSIIIDDIANRPVANNSNTGYLFITNVPVPSSGSSYPQQAFVSNGTSWIEIINRESFTAESTFTGDMEKSEYTNGLSSQIAVSKGGTGKDLSQYNDGALIFSNGEVNVSKNYLSTQVVTFSTDLLLTNSSASVQIINANVPNIFLPDAPLSTTYFRLINASSTNSPTLKYNNITIRVISPETTIDLHYNETTNNWIVLTIG